MSGLYKKIRSYLHNTLWIMGDKIVNLAIGFIVTVLVARHLGPESFGVFSYAISLAALFGVAGHMGLSGLVVREIVKKPDQRSVTLGTTLGLKLSGMLLGYTVLLIYAFIYEDVGSIEFWAIIIAGGSLLFRSVDIVDFWFQAFVQARYVTFARVTALLLASLLKLLFVFMGAGVIFFVSANLAQAIVVAVALLVIYRLKSTIKLSVWRFDWGKAKELLSQSWMIYLGSIFAIVNLKVDQVMIRWFLGSESVGIYAVAAQLSEAWSFIPTAIVASFFPMLIKLRENDEAKFNRRLQQLFDLLFILAVSVALLMTFFSGWAISLFFGSAYTESADILVIHTWAAVFIFMRAAFSRWILIENALMFSLLTQGMGALVNVVLNYYMIPVYGGVGAAYATLLSYAMSSFFALMFYKKTRPVFFMMINSLFFVFRYFKFKVLK